MGIKLIKILFVCLSDLLGQKCFLEGRVPACTRTQTRMPLMHGLPLSEIEAREETGEERRQSEGEERSQGGGGGEGSVRVGGWGGKSREGMGCHRRLEPGH